MVARKIVGGTLMVAVMLMVVVDHSSAHDAHGNEHGVQQVAFAPGGDPIGHGPDEALGCCMIAAHCFGAALISPALRPSVPHALPMVLSAPAHDLLLPGQGVAPERKPPKRML